MSRKEGLPHPMSLPKQQLTSLPSVNVILSTSVVLKKLHESTGIGLTFFDLIILSTLMSLPFACSWSNLSRVIFNYPQHRKHRTYQSRLNRLVELELVKKNTLLGYSCYAISARGKALMIRFDNLTIQKTTQGLDFS